MPAFDIRLEGFDGGAGEAPEAALARLFGITQAQAEGLLGALPHTVKRGVPQELALQMVAALQDAGARAALVPSTAATAGIPASPPSPALASAAPAPIPIPAPVVPDLNATPAGAETPPSDARGSSGDFPAISLRGQEPGGTLARAPEPGTEAPWPPVPPAGVVRCVGCGVVLSPAALSIAQSLAQGGPLRCVACHAPPPPRTHATYRRALLDAMRGLGTRAAAAWFLTVGGTCHLLSLLPLGWLLASGVALLAYSQVFRRAVAGYDDMPTDISATGFGDFLAVIGSFALALLIPFIPLGMLYATEAGAAALWLGGAFGVLYMPASMILAGTNGSGFASLHVVAGLRLIARIPTAYFLTCLLTAAAWVLNMGLHATASFIEQTLRAVPLLPGILGSTLGLIAPVMVARMLGTLLQHHEDELGLYAHGTED